MPDKKPIISVGRAKKRTFKPQRAEGQNHAGREQISGAKPAKITYVNPLGSRTYGLVVKRSATTGKFERVRVPGSVPLRKPRVNIFEVAKEDPDDALERAKEELAEERRRLELHLISGKDLGLL